MIVEGSLLLTVIQVVSVVFLLILLGIGAYAYFDLLLRELGIQ